jgi:peptidoglycan-associated lipoprotein
MIQPRSHCKSAAALGAALTAMLALSACATKPKPEAAAPAPPPAQAEAPSTAPGPAPVQRSLQEDLAATAGDRVFFALDSHVLSDDARATLERQAAWLAQNPSVRVLVAGNCDERGTREYNLALGARRASAARDLLVARGVASSRIDTVSYGKERPIDPASTDEAWSRNRNAHTVLIDAAAL